MRRLFLLLAIIICYQFSYSQNNVGIGTIAPNSNAILELDNNGNPLGLLLPRQDISTFTLAALDAGLMVFNPIDDKVYTWDGTTWVSSSSEWGVNGANIFNLNSGNVGIGTTTPNAPLQFSNALANRKIVLFESTNNDHQYYGFGINSTVMRYQISGNFASHVFYAAASAASSTELMRVTGTGRLELPGTTDASGTAGSGVLEVANSLRIDGNEIITNTNASLFIQNDNNGDLAVDANTLFVDASANRVGIINTAPLASLDVNGDVLALNGVFSTNTISQEITVSTNNDHIWHNDVTNSWHMVSDDTYKALGNTTLNIGRLLVNNDATSNCTTGPSPFFFENCTDVSSEIEFNFSGNFTGTQTTAMPDMDILAVSDGSGFIGTFINSGRFDFRQNNAVMVTIANSAIYPAGDNSGSCGLSANRWSTIYAANGTINTSDRRLKENIEDLNYGLGKVMKMRPVTFDWKDKPNGKKIGLIAQELQEIIPEVVNIGDDKNKTLGVYYSDLIPVLVKAIQEQQYEIEELKGQVQNLQTSLQN